MARDYNKAFKDLTQIKQIKNAVEIVLLSQIESKTDRKVILKDC